jgi:monoamine oxidase
VRVDSLTRRRFLELTCAAGTAYLLSEGTSAWGKERPHLGTRPRVVVIGAGFAGLACAFELAGAGADVSVIEARHRVGGRVISIDDFLPGVVVEGGGEFIGANHPTWVSYAKRFGLELVDAGDDEDDRSPVMINGKVYVGKEVAKIWEEIEGALQAITADSKGVDTEAPWKSPHARKLDHTTLAEAAKQWPMSATTRAAFSSLLQNDDACALDRTSYLFYLTAVAGGGGARYWTDSEAYRCRGGNQRLAWKLAEALGDRVRLREPVESVNLAENQGVTVRLRKGDVLEADAAVLTVPPSAWDTIRFHPSLPDDYRVHLGPAVKFLARVKSAFWSKLGLNPAGLTDTLVGTTWDASDRERTSPEMAACLTVFAGGAPAEMCLELAPDALRRAIGEELDKVFPGYSRQVEKTMFLGWPREAFTKCGYSALAPGQVTTCWPKIHEGFRDRLFFAGEHTSLNFPGFMEGALHSGAKLARRLAGRLNLTGAAK